jgi:hypothetical protein
VSRDGIWKVDTQMRSSPEIITPQENIKTKVFLSRWLAKRFFFIPRILSYLW